MFSRLAEFRSACFCQIPLIDSYVQAAVKLFSNPASFSENIPRSEFSEEDILGPVKREKDIQGHRHTGGLKSQKNVRPQNSGQLGAILYALRINLFIFQVYPDWAYVILKCNFITKYFQEIRYIFLLRVLKLAQWLTPHSTTLHGTILLETVLSGSS